MSATRVLAISGGIGGAKLALGLYRELSPDTLMVVCNTGDDFEHLGLSVSPDVDTVIYTLAGIANTETGWGLAGETWSFMSALERLGGETWFRLGDGDLATHVERTRRLAAGESPGAICAHLCRRLGVHAKVLPMSDAPVRTIVLSDTGPLGFQHYFVRLRCAPRVSGFAYRGADTARVQDDVAAALTGRDLQAVIVCPSNPFISVGPVLAVSGMRAALAASGVPVVAVSPVIGRRAVKGPTAKMMAELGLSVSARSVAEHYGDLLDGYVVDESDADECHGIQPALLAAPILMRDEDDKRALARRVLDFATTL